MHWLRLWLQPSVVEPYSLYLQLGGLDLALCGVWWVFVLFVPSLPAGLGKCPRYLSSVTVQGVFLKTTGDGAPLGSGTAPPVSAVSAVC